MSKLITVAVQDIKFLKEYYGYTLLNEHNYKLQNSVKGFVWEVEKSVTSNDGKEDTTRILYRKLEDAIHHLAWDKLEGLENYSGSPSIVKVLNDNHIHIYGLNSEGIKYTLSITTAHLF